MVVVRLRVAATACAARGDGVQPCLWYRAAAAGVKPKPAPHSVRVQ